MSLPDCNDWLSRLWLACFHRFETGARTSFMGMAKDRLKLYNRNGKALADNMPKRERERQESGESISPSAVQPTFGHVKQLASNLAYLELDGSNAHSPVASQKRGENVSNRSSLSSPVSEALSMTDITKGISREASHTTQKILNTSALYTSHSEVAAEVRGEETRPSVLQLPSPEVVKQFRSGVSTLNPYMPRTPRPVPPRKPKWTLSNHLELHGPNTHSLVVSQKGAENVSNRLCLTSLVPEASSMTDITKGMSQEAPPHSSEGGAIHVNEEDLELGVMAESMLVGAAYGAAVTGILGMGLVGLAEAAEDGSVH